MRLYIGLVHYPVYNKNYQVIASAITTVDIHDIARLSRTYGVKIFFVINPLDDQRRLAERVKRHWTAGYGANYNKDRKEAIALLKVVHDLSTALHMITEIEKEAPIMIATDASRQKDCSISYKETSKIISEDRVVILIFGTAWGLGKSVIEDADYVLEPIYGKTGYRHLSVRSAAAIILDRLVGRHD
jgi:hypothetical protein